MKRLRGNDSGSSILEVLIGSAIAMIGLAILASLLAVSQKQQKTLTEVTDALGEARVAMTRVTDEVRGAKWIEASGATAVAWMDADRDGIRIAAEDVTFRIETVSGVTRLVRVQNGATTLLATGLQSGSLTVSTGKNAAELTLTLSLPGRDGKTGTTISSKVSTRANG
jgi:Tfp pilus assembly protein PilW